MCKAAGKQFRDYARLTTCDSFLSEAFFRNGNSRFGTRADRALSGCEPGIAAKAADGFSFRPVAVRFRGHIHRGGRCGKGAAPNAGRPRPSPGNRDRSFRPPPIGGAAFAVGSAAGRGAFAVRSVGRRRGAAGRAPPSARGRRRLGACVPRPSSCAPHPHPCAGEAWGSGGVGGCGAPRPPFRAVARNPVPARAGRAWLCRAVPLCRAAEADGVRIR